MPISTSVLVVAIIVGIGALSPAAQADREHPDKRPCKCLSRYVVERGTVTAVPKRLGCADIYGGVIVTFNSEATKTTEQIGIRCADLPGQNGAIKLRWLRKAGPMGFELPRAERIDRLFGKRPLRVVNNRPRQAS